MFFSISNVKVMGGGRTSVRYQEKPEEWGSWTDKRCLLQKCDFKCWFWINVIFYGKYFTFVLRRPHRSKQMYFPIFLKNNRVKIWLCGLAVLSGFLQDSFTISTFGSCIDKPLKGNSYLTHTCHFMVFKWWKNLT